MCVEIIKVASEVLNFSRQRMLVNMRFLEPAIRMLTESPSKCMCNRSYGMGTDGKNLYYNPEYVLSCLLYTSSWCAVRKASERHSGRLKYAKMIF